MDFSVAQKIAFKLLATWIMSSCFFLFVDAQNPTVTTIDPKEFVLDGIPNEPFWQKSIPATDFKEYFPNDRETSEYQTHIWFASDKKHLYIALRCDVPGKDFVISSLRRDYQAGGSDNITLIFDPFQTGRNALIFGMNPLGVNREALISNGGEDYRDFSEAWDNTWRGESAITDSSWTSELKIPLSILRFPENNASWGFNAYRFDTQTNSISTWTGTPRNQSLTSLSYNQPIIWDNQPKAKGNNISLIPYTYSQVSQNLPNSDDNNIKTNFSVGGDAKIGLNSSLNLDLTINPDFSQVDVDQQVINLTRFELSFPEKRQFFLENADLFGSFGFNRNNPFFSRRIGLSTDPVTGETVNNKIWGGARLSGQLNDKWRIGLMTMQSAQDKSINLPGYNFSVGAIERKIGNRSSLGIITANKQNLSSFKDTSFTNLDYNRVLGVDFKLATKNNRWTGKIFAHGSQTPNINDQKVENSSFGLTHGLQGIYKSTNVYLEYDQSWIGENYNSEVGFVPRKDIFTFHGEARYTFYPKEKWITSHGPGAETRYFYTANLDQYLDQRKRFYYNFRFRNNSRLTFSLRHSYVYLSSSFDPSRSGGLELPESSDYSFWYSEGSYNSDSRPLFSYQLNSQYGNFFNGKLFGLGGNIKYRFQPYGFFRLNSQYRKITLPKPYSSNELWLISPIIDLTLTRKIFVSGIAQYQTNTGNIDYNIRFQWRYAPVSDFFLVYTYNNNFKENYAPPQALTAKFSYWFNL